MLAQISVMAGSSDLVLSSRLKYYVALELLDSCFSDTNEDNINMLKERFRCPRFRILVMGRANAGKTTILEKVCGVAKGTRPIIYDKHGKPIQNLCPLIHILSQAKH